MNDPTLVVGTRGRDRGCIAMTYRYTHDWECRQLICCWREVAAAQQPSYDAQGPDRQPFCPQHTDLCLSPRSFSPASHCCCCCCCSGPSYAAVTQAACLQAVTHLMLAGVFEQIAACCRRLPNAAELCSHRQMNHLAQGHIHSGFLLPLCRPLWQGFCILLAFVVVVMGATPSCPLLCGQVQPHSSCNDNMGI